MDISIVFGTQFLLSLVAFSLVARWYVAPRLARKSSSSALSVLLLPHAFRHIGLAFLVPGLVADELPRSFAMEAAYGDFTTGLMAIVALVALQQESRVALMLVGLTNFVGMMDLANALSQASVIPHLGFTWFIPTFVVPLLLVTHAMMVSRLYCLVRQRLGLERQHPVTSNVLH